MVFLKRCSHSLVFDPRITGAGGPGTVSLIVSKTAKMIEGACE